MKQPDIVIIGAGFAGRSIAEEIRGKGILGKVAAFIDDDPAKIGTAVDGIPVFGPIRDFAAINKELQVREGLIAVPTAEKQQLKRIYEYLTEANVTKIRIIPSVSQIIDGDPHLIQTREIDPQDLLGRTPVTIPLKESLTYLRGKRVLITGAGGSIGSELARQLLFGGAERLYLFGHGENSIYEIDRELRLLQEEGVGDKATIVPVIGDLQDREFIHFLFQRLRADVVFHCAAYKHVPLVEANPVEAVKNNVFGTLHLTEACRDSETSKLVLISTDKAVRPVSVYGASKSIAEQIVLRENGGGTECMVVRFGNVLGSRGSITPLFQKQILKGGPVTITDPGVKRFFMTIPEAASLVLQTGGVGTGGGLYILDMGDPVLIEDLARQMIQFYGFEPEKDIEIRYIGLRPGEKMLEQLWDSGKTPKPTEHARVLTLPKESAGELDIPGILAELEPVCFFSETDGELYRNRNYLKKIIHGRIPTVPYDSNDAAF
jgi:FlaA1/EpsC-like NDP-sugar epimerase